MQRGSQVKLRRILVDGTKQTLHVPNHPELDSGTCRAIFRQASAFIVASELAPHFHADR